MTFQPALPARGATRTARAHTRALPDFNPRSPRGERRGHGVPEIVQADISTRAPREGSDPHPPAPASTPRNFNPRSPRGERPRPRLCGHLVIIRFQPALPARGATPFAHLFDDLDPDFNPRSPRGERHEAWEPKGQHATYFNPRSPRGERPSSVLIPAMDVRFQPALPARGATCSQTTTSTRGWQFQPALPARGATRRDFGQA